MWLICGDLHLTEHARDEYRFGIFDWIKRQQTKRDVAATFLLGDLTDSKDRHSATLVNKIVNGLTGLKPPVYVLRGNHDYSKDQSNPFFDFLNHIEGLTFATNPMLVKHVRQVALIPHYRSQEEFNAAVKATAHGAECFLLHQTFEGAIAESGVRLSGLSASPIELLKPRLGVYAGDVHRPQTQGIVTYVGCPYQVRFGDNFEPRSLWMDQMGTTKSMEFPAPRKWALRVRDAASIVDNSDLCEGDQVKLTIEMAREEVVSWKQVKQDVLAACHEMGLEVYGVKMEVNTVKRRERLHVEGSSLVSLDDTLRQFCKAENIAAEIRKVGFEMLSDV